MRQMAVCNRTSLENCFSTWIIIHPSKKLQERLSASRGDTMATLDKLEVLELRLFSNHLIIIFNALENWSAYLEYLSSEFKNRVSIQSNFVVRSTCLGMALLTSFE
jgi:hypothetical protein